MPLHEAARRRARRCCTVPALGPRKPSSSEISVLLPAPFGPARPNTSPARISSEKSVQRTDLAAPPARVALADLVEDDHAGRLGYGETGARLVARRVLLSRLRCRDRCARHRARRRRAARPRAAPRALDPVHPLRPRARAGSASSPGSPATAWSCASACRARMIEASRAVVVLLRERHRRELAQRERVRRPERHRLHRLLLRRLQPPRLARHARQVDVRHGIVRRVLRRLDERARPPPRVVPRDTRRPLARTPRSPSGRRACTTRRRRRRRAPAAPSSGTTQPGRPLRCTGTGIGCRARDGVAARAGTAFTGAVGARCGSEPAAAAARRREAARAGVAPISPASSLRKASRAALMSARRGLVVGPRRTLARRVELGQRVRLLELTGSAAAAARG